MEMTYRALAGMVGLTTSLLEAESNGLLAEQCGQKKIAAENSA